MSSTRSKSKKNEPVKKVTHHKYCDTKVFLIDGKQNENIIQNNSFVKKTLSIMKCNVNQFIKI